MAALDAAAASGFAVQRGLAQRMIASLGRAVLLEPAGTPVCALTLVGPVDEFDDARLPGLRAALGEAGDRLGTVLAGLAGTE